MEEKTDKRFDVELKEKRPLSYKEQKQKRIREVETEFQAKRKPYDRYSALIDLQDEIDIIMRKYRTTFGNKLAELEKELQRNDIFDEKRILSYGDPKRFKIVSVRLLETEKLIDNIKQTVQDQTRVEFEAERGNIISMDMPNKMYEELYAEKKPVIK